MAKTFNFYDPAAQSYYDMADDNDPLKKLIKEIVKGAHQVAADHDNDREKLIAEVIPGILGDIASVKMEDYPSREKFIEAIYERCASIFATIGIIDLSIALAVRSKESSCTDIWDNKD